MIKFFRKIRQKLLSENRFTKYLFYAMGEIVLVVIGILIALGINDYYANVKSKERLTDLLKEVRTELAVNIDRGTQLLEWYSFKDSIISMVLSDTLKREVYSENGDIRGVIGSYDTYEIKSNAFDRLMANNSALPSRYDSLVDALKTIYVSDSRIIKSLNESINNVVQENSDRIKRTQPWYAEWTYSSKISEEASEMMFSDPIYRNYVADYWLLGVANHGFFIHQIRTNAYIVYRMLSNELGLSDDIGATFTSTFNTSNSAGVYIFESDTIRISDVDGRIHYQQATNPMGEVLPYGDSQFIPSTSLVFCRFTKDSEGQVNGLIQRNGSYHRTFLKQQ